MYRIELSPGEETVFRSIEELAVAIKRGVVSPRARIYHNASSKWLPIQFHPHYKTALSMPLSQSALVAGPPAKPLSSLSLDAIPAELPLPQVPQPVTVAAKPAPEEKPVQEPRKKPAKEKPASEKRQRSSGKQGKQLRIALIGALLVGGGQWVLSEPLFSRTDVAGLFHSHRRLIVEPANTAAMIPLIQPEVPSAAIFGGRARATAKVAPPAPSPASGAGSTEEVEPAPDAAIDAAIPSLPSIDSLARKSADSSDQRAIKGILREVSGASTKQNVSRHR